MARPRIYVETTIPSFYYEAWQTPDTIARRDWTRQWWSLAVGRDGLVTSEVVLQELGAGPEQFRGPWLKLIADLPLLRVNKTVIDAVAVYVQNRLMPATGGDAFHLALASCYNCDALATWNYKHLANANKYRHVRLINESLGLAVPDLVTPLELLGGLNDEGL